MGNGGGEELIVRVSSLSDMVMEFFEGSEGPPTNSPIDGGDDNNEEEENECSGDAEERKAFWESQLQLLQASLCRTSSFESRIRRDVKSVLSELRSSSETACSCSKGVVKQCRSCTLRAVGDRLRAAGYDCAVCKSKWRSSDDIPSGEHNYLDIVKTTTTTTTTTTKKTPTRIVIELNFRAEFEMARASEAYVELVHGLPEVFVGKPEKLRNVIKVVCRAAKRCMKDNNMHLAPWRKHKYVQAKWLSPSSERAPPGGSMPAVAEKASSGRKTVASMLTFDLLGTLPAAGLHCSTVVKVV